MIRFVLILVFISTLTACYKQIDHIPAESYTLELDFSRYSEKGFLITPGEYGQDHTSLGIIKIIEYPEANYVQAEKLEGYGQDYTIKKWKKGIISKDNMIDSIYKKAIGRGADAITHFKLNQLTKSIPLTNGESITIEGLEVSGLLIKRH